MSRFSPAQTGVLTASQMRLRPRKSQRRGGFFDPHEVELLFHLADFSNGLFGRPVFVGVDHQAGFVGVDAEGVVHKTDAAEVAVLV